MREVATPPILPGPCYFRRDVRFKFVFVRCWGYRQESGAQVLEEKIDYICV
jgi:hypothetical protein